MTGTRTTTTRRHRAPGQARLDSDAAGAHPFLALQRTIGNRALSELATRGGSVPVPGANRLIPVQLASGATALAEAPAPQPPPDIEASIEAQVNALPDLDDAAVPAAAQVDAGRQEASAVAAEQQELGLGGNQAIADFLAHEMDAPPVGPAISVVAELANSSGDVDLPEPQPSKWARLTASAGRGAAAVGRGARAAGGALWSGVKAVGGGIWGGVKAVGRGLWGGMKAIGRGAREFGGSVKQKAGAIRDEAAEKLSTAEGRHDVAAKAQAGAATGVSGAKDAYMVTGTSLPAQTPTLESGTYAKDAAAGGAEAAHTVAGTIGLFFSALKAAVDLRSLVSTVKVIRGLKQAKAAALDSGADPAMVELIDYAIRKKYHKVIKKAIGAAAALAALGVGLAILIANPVGASLAAIIIAGVSLGLLAYKLGKKAWKHWGSKSLGQKRNAMADRLYAGVLAGNTYALDAAKALHLNIDDLSSSPHGRDMIARKLKSA